MTPGRGLWRQGWDSLVCILKIDQLPLTKQFSIYLDGFLSSSFDRNFPERKLYKKISKSQYWSLNSKPYFKINTLNIH